MEGETSTLRSSSKSLVSKKSFDTITILVVDDDTTCLSIVASILKRFKYQVVTVKHPNDALCTLRIKGGAFDLVVSDVHMPDMNGFELQKVISKEFNLPVVLMSADDKEGNVLKGMENGAAFFIVKPVCEDDLRDLWQFAAMKKKSRVVIEETGSSPHEKTWTRKNNAGDQLTVSASSVNDRPNANYYYKDSKRKSPKKEGSYEKKGENSESSTKRQKIVWTNSLHNQFLEAIRTIGLDRAVPKKILEIMNVPGLTRENVASHLQKYRIFLRRVSEASCDTQYPFDKGLSRNIMPSLASSSVTNLTPMLNGLTKFQYQNPSSNNLLTNLGSGQSRLLSNTGSLLRPNIGNTNLIHQNPRPYDGLAHNNCQNSPSVQGHMTNMTLENISRALSVGYDGPTRKSHGIGNEVSSYLNNIGCNANPNPNPNPVTPTTNFTPNPVTPTTNFTPQTNYVGISISNLKDLLGGLEAKGKRKGLNSDSGTTNPPSDESRNIRVNNEALMTNHEIIDLDEVSENVGDLGSFVPENNGGDQVSDIIGDYEMLLPSDISFSGMENGGEINEAAFSPLFDFPGTLDVMTNQQPLEEADFNTSFADQVNMPIQGQTNGAEIITSSGFFSGTDWDNNVPSFDQASSQVNWPELIESQLNNTILLPTNEKQIDLGFGPLQFGTTSQLINTTPQSPTEQDEDDFLESLLLPFDDDDETLEGI